MSNKYEGFTPGPWKVVKPQHGHETELRCVQIGRNEMYTTLELKAADAHLIAIAPKLLKQRDALRDALEKLRDGDHIDVPINKHCAVMSIIKAALALCEDPTGKAKE